MKLSASVLARLCLIGGSALGAAGCETLEPKEVRSPASPLEHREEEPAPEQAETEEAAPDPTPAPALAPVETKAPAKKPKQSKAHYCGPCGMG